MFLHSSWFQPSASEISLQNLQEEVPLCLLVQMVQYEQQFHLSSLQKSVLTDVIK